MIWGGKNEIINRLHLHGETMTQDEAFFIMDALEEIQQYRAIGTVEDLKSMKENGAFSGVELAQLAAMQMRLREYQKIGTIEELYYIEPEENQSAGMREFATLHDELLEHEHNILSDVEMLSDLREKLYQNKDKNILKEIRPVLNAILHDTENYICWLESKGGV